MTDQNTPEPRRLNQSSSETTPKGISGKFDLKHDPDYLKFLELFQNGEFEKCRNFVKELERRYPGHPEVRKIKENLEFKLSLRNMSAKNKLEGVKKRAKATFNLGIFAIFGFVVVVIAIVISFTHFRQQVVQEENLQKTAQTSSLNRLYAQAEELLLFGQPQPALEVLGKIQAIDPSFSNVSELEAWANYLLVLEAKYQQGIALQEEGNFEEALQIFKEINDEEPGLWDINQRINQILTSMDIESLLAEGDNAYQAENWDMVITSYETALMIDPTLGSEQIDERLFQAYLNKIIAMLQSETTSVEDIEDAEQYYREAMALLTPDKNFSTEKANLEDVSKQLLKLKYSQTAYNMLADKQQTEVSLATAISYLAKAADFDPEDSKLQADLKNAKTYQTAFGQFINMNWEPAINNLTSIISSDPNFAGGNVNLLMYESYYFLGDQYFSARLYEDALKILEQAEIIIWNDPDNLFKLFKLQLLIGDVYAQLENYENAVSYYQYALNAINLGSRLMNYPDVTEKYAEGNIAADNGEYKTAYKNYTEMIGKLNFIFKTDVVEIGQGVCLALFAGEYHSTVDAILDANNLPKSMVLASARSLIVPTIEE